MMCNLEWQDYIDVHYTISMAGMKAWSIEASAFANMVGQSDGWTKMEINALSKILGLIQAYPKLLNIIV